MMIKMFSPRAQHFEKSVFFFSLGLFQKISFRPWMGGKKNSKNRFFYENNLSLLSTPSVKTF